MDGFEEAFDRTTEVADAAIKANQNLATQLRRLRKASLDGNITAVKREQGRLSETLVELDRNPPVDVHPLLVKAGHRGLTSMLEDMQKDLRAYENQRTEADTGPSNPVQRTRTQDGLVPASH